MNLLYLFWTEMGYGELVPGGKRWLQPVDKESYRIPDENARADRSRASGTSADQIRQGRHNR